MKKPIVLLLLLPALLLALSGSTLEDENAVEKYKNYTPGQIAKLPEAVRKSELPMMYTFAAREGLSSGSETLFAMYLNILMYSGIYDYDAAVRQFQRDLGDKPDGVLTVWQIHNLRKFATMQKLARVLFPDQFSSYITDQYASVQGTFVILDDRIAYPINHAEVSCYKVDGYCEVEQIFLDTPDDNSWSQNFHVMQFDPEIYSVINWTKDTIDAVPENQNSGACRTSTMNLNFTTKEFYQIARNTAKKCEVLGETMPSLEHPRISQIVDGEEIIAQEFADLEQKAFDVLASDFRATVEKLIAEESRKE